MAARSSKGRPTLEQVAARAGVGRGTVSRVINDSPKVSAPARRAVLRAIDELGYVPDEAARALAGRGGTGTVALVLAEDHGLPFEQPYFGKIIRGVAGAVGESGLQLALTIAQPSRRPRQLMTELVGHRVDGVLLISLRHDDPLAGLLERGGVPTILGGRPVTPGEERTAYVEADNRGGARRATEYLARQGRRRIATIAGAQARGAGIDRLAGYRDVCGDRPELTAYGDFSVASGAAAMRRLLDREPSLDAVFAACDNMALGALSVLKDRGRRVPHDVAVIGFEDSAEAVRARPALTTVHQPTERMGRAMADLLVARLHGGEPADPGVICDTHLVLRESA